MALDIHEERSRWHTEPLQIDEVITLFGNRYLREHRSGSGWARESGMLERRRASLPVAVERRRLTPDP